MDNESLLFKVQLGRIKLNLYKLIFKYIIVNIFYLFIFFGRFVYRYICCYLYFKIY